VEINDGSINAVMSCVCKWSINPVSDSDPVYRVTQIHATISVETEYKSLALLVFYKIKFVLLNSICETYSPEISVGMFLLRRVLDLLLLIVTSCVASFVSKCTDYFLLAPLCH
jgi:hypothetical protein